MFTPTEQTILLKEHWLSENKRGIALDIDETLARTNELFFRVLFERFGNPENISVEDAILKYKTSHEVPYWQTPEVQAFLGEIRRDAKFNLGTKPIQGAKEAIQEISKHTECLCYITARTESLREATEQWLELYGFPKIPVIMRPNDIDDAHMTIWKGPTLEYLYPAILGIIDDNPSFTHTVSKDYKGVLFLYDRKTTPQTHIETFVCPAWSDVIT